MPETEEQQRRTGSRWALVAALGLWLAAAALAGAGVVLVFLLGICEDGDCLSTRERLAWGVLPMALSALPLWGAVAQLFRWLGVSQPLGRRAAAIALLLVAYALAVGAVAWWLDSEGAIYGDGPWLAFWLGSAAGWLALGFGLVLLRLHPRRRGVRPTATRKRALLLAALPAAALAAAAGIALVPESRPTGTVAGPLAQRLDDADGCIGFEQHTYSPDPRTWPGSRHPELTRRASSLELVRCRRTHADTRGEGTIWTFPSAAAAAVAVRAAGPGDIPVCLAGRDVVDAHANSVPSNRWLEELCRVGLDGRMRRVDGEGGP